MKLNRDELFSKNIAYIDANKITSIANARRVATYKRRKKRAKEQACISISRNKHGMTRGDLARMIGVSPSTIYSWERGYTTANWDMLCAVLVELEAYRPKGR